MKELGIDLLGANRQNHSLFNSQYPIVSALMNQVSEETLAVAVSRAGGFPSISGYCYSSDDELILALERFVDQTGKSDLILGIDERSLLNAKLVTTIKDLKISHILRYANEDLSISETTKVNWRKIVQNVLDGLSCFKIELKHTFDSIKNTETIYFVKGNDGAGRPGLATTKELFDYHIAATPNARLVPTGAIGTYEQVRYYLDAGAVAVGCGTLFAAAKESVLSTDSKQALINATRKDLTVVDTNLKQLGLIFNRIENDNLNNTASLKAGISSSKNGLLFAGHAVDHIASIEPVSTILTRLMNHTR